MKRAVFRLALAAVIVGLPACSSSKPGGDKQTPKVSRRPKGADGQTIKPEKQNDQ